jgi:hypothetical protein
MRHAHANAEKTDAGKGGTPLGGSQFNQRTQADGEGE